MIEQMKNWINTILCLGIFFTIIRMILPNTNLKKYISSLVGVVTIIVVISPVVQVFQGNNLEGSIKDILLNVTMIETLNTGYTNLSNYEDINKNNVKERFKSSVEEDIKEKLQANINGVVSVSIKITDTYNIDSVSISAPKDTDFDIKNFLRQEYDIDYKKIEVIKE